MAVLAGIDEAGFGPILGPLVVTGIAFQLPDHDLDKCLWEALRESCTSAPARRDLRLLIADSKRMYRSGSDLALLERAALVMLAVSHAAPETFRSLLQTICPGAADELAAYPWYGPADPRLPITQGAGDIATRANAVRQDCARQGIQMIGAFCELLPEGRYNRLVESTRNKSVALLGQVLRVVRRVLQSNEEKTVRIVVDRLGGRVRYREALSVEFPQSDLRILEESEERSAYRMVRGSRSLQVEFLTNGETRHLPIALASVYSKYVRELCMKLFNQYWSARQEGLRPTAGYYTDGMRWLREAAPLLERLAVDRRTLVRER